MIKIVQNRTNNNIIFCINLDQIDKNKKYSTIRKAISKDSSVTKLQILSISES